MTSARDGWAKFYQGWGDLMSAFSEVFNQWAMESFYKSAQLYHGEAVQLAEIVKGLTSFDDGVGVRSTLHFDENVDSDGYPWAPRVGDLRKSVIADPAKEGESVQVFVFGSPAVGKFEGTEFHPEEETHGEDGR